MTYLKNWTDNQLISELVKVREAAHGAPKCISGTEEQPYISGDAWARHSNYWSEIVEELKSRVLNALTPQAEQKERG